MTITEAIKKAVDRIDLTGEEAESVLDQIMTGQCTDAQIASLLTALRSPRLAESTCRQRNRTFSAPWPRSDL